MTTWLARIGIDNVHDANIMFINNVVSIKLERSKGIVCVQNIFSVAKNDEITQGLLAN
jgi:hypothetical protein